jgi:hypothetical protein
MEGGGAALAAWKGGRQAKMPAPPRQNKHFNNAAASQARSIGRAFGDLEVEHYMHPPLSI